MVRMSSSESPTPKGTTAAAVASRVCVIGIAAHREPIVQAVNDAMPRPEPAGGLRAGADDGGLVGIRTDSARFIAVPVVPEVRWMRAFVLSGAAR